MAIATICIAIYGAAIATLALAIAMGASFKAYSAQRDVQSMVDHLMPPSIDFSSALRRQDLAQ